MALRLNKLLLGALVTLVLSGILSVYKQPGNKDEKESGSTPDSDDGRVYKRICAALAERIPGRVFDSKHASFTKSVRSYWSLQECEVIPRCIVMPVDTQDVSRVVQILKREYDTQISDGQAPLQFAVRSGGHSPEAGFANVDGGIVIDLSQLNQVIVGDDRTNTVIGPGARWLDVSSKLDTMGLAVAGGRNSNVGVGGLILGDGISFFSPRVGFVCSNINSYEIVLANGTIATASSAENSDLWRALKGGSNNFGIVTAFTARTFPSRNVWAGYLYWTGSKAPQVLTAFNDFSKVENFDEFASGPILAFGYVRRFGLSFNVVASSVVYTKLEAWPKCWPGFKAIRRLWSTTRIQSLSDATRELDAQSPSGLRQFQVTTTIENDFTTLNETYLLFKKSIDAIRRVDGMTWSLVLQPLPTAIMSKGTPNALGLVGRNESALIVVLLSTSWKRTSHDALVERTARHIIEEIEKAASARGTAHRYRYLNYAASG